MTAAEQLAATREQERRTAERRELHARALQWSREHFPERVEGAHPCPFAAHFAMQDRARHGGPVSVARVRARLEAHDARHAEPVT